MNSCPTVAIVGAGPAGLMAAQRLQGSGLAVDVYDALPTAGRKFLLAGRGGLNLTHSEEAGAFVARYGARAAEVGALLQDFDPAALRAWALALGVATFVGSSGRVFPVGMKAAPLLRAWLHRLREPAAGAPVQFHMRHRWTGWDADGALCFDTPAGALRVHADACLLALGGASWPRMGSDGAWVPWLAQRGVPIAALRPANCGFDVQGGWSDFFRTRFAGVPFKSVAITLQGANGVTFSRKGEFVATESGVEGSLIYAASAQLRDQIESQGSALFLLDLLPQFAPERVLQEVSHGRGTRSLASHLKSRLGLDGIKLALLHELLDTSDRQRPDVLARAIKQLPVRLSAARPIAEAISSAGGVPFEALTPGLMLHAAPGVFCAGEMLDWEAPTGGYLLQAVMASGYRAGDGVARWLAQNRAMREVDEP